MTDKLWRKIAWRLPHRLVMWCAYRIIAYATGGKHERSVNAIDLTAMDAMGRWLTMMGE